MTIRAWLGDEPESGQKTREPRRRVLLEGLGASASSDVSAVTVHNISATGILLECGEALELDDSLSIDLPDAPGTEAVVVWVSGQLHGCKFAQPLTRATLSAAMLRSTVSEESDAVPIEHPAAPAPEEPLGVRLRRLRKARGLSLADLAAELGVSKPTIWAWEHGRSAPAPDRHERIAEVFETSISSLRTGRDGNAAMTVLERSREQIAQAFGVSADKIRVMIEL